VHFEEVLHRRHPIVIYLIISIKLKYSSMSIGSWAIQLKSGKPYNLKPRDDHVLNITQAVLDAPSDAAGKTYQVTIQTKDIDGKPLSFLAVILRKNTADQANLQLVFPTEVPITLSLSGGEGTVHLAGFLQPTPDMPESDDDEMMRLRDEDNEEDESSDEDESV